MGAFLAAGGAPKFSVLFWITLAITGARSAALAIDNIVDLEYDKVHPRFKRRPMVTGAVTLREAVLWTAASLALCIIAVLQLPPICIRLLPVAAVPFIIYPFMKRVTFCCHGVLGIAIAMAPAGGWVAVRASIGAPMIMLPLALEMARVFHIACIVCFVLTGFMVRATWPYYLGVLIAAVTLVYQHLIIAPYDFSSLTQAYFMRNGVVSVAMFLCTWLSYCVG